MSTTTKHKVWLVLLVIGIATSAPLNDERIYFPGESQELEPRGYGLQPNMLPSQEHQSYRGVGQDVSEEQAWPQNNNPQTPVLESGYQGRPELPAYQEQNGYGAGYSGQPQRTLPYAPVNWGTDSQQGNIEKSHHMSSYSASSFQHSAESPGAYVPNGPSPLQGASYSSITNNGIHHGVHHGGQKVTKHTWTSQHLASGSGELQHGPQYIVHQEADNQGQDQRGLEHSFSSVAHQAHSTNDLSSIIGGPTQQGHELHPTIQQALGNVIGHSSGKVMSQPSQHTVHKISHMKKTSIQNVGQEPVLIQSTSSNDDISLSHLIEELKMLENSPRHINITWCEEKIKEFLQSLRRKQASGVFINQQVQEETLHQILTHEGVQNTDSSGGVNEPVVTKVTVRPLGREDMTKSQVESETFAHHQESHIDRNDVEAPHPPTDQIQEESKSNTDTEVITIIPHANEQRPEIMAHQHEFGNQSPPLTSDNTKDLQELDLDLPEYVPFEHALSGDIQAAAGNFHKETRPFPKPVEGETSEGHLVATETQHQQEASSSETHQENEDRVTQELKDMSNHQIDSETSHDGKMISEQKKEQIEEGSSNHAESNYLGGKVNYEQLQNTSQHHNIQGRPQAPEGELEGTAEKSQEENIMHSGQSSGSVGSSATIDEAGNGFVLNSSAGGHYTQTHQSTTIQTLHKQQINYDTLIEELIQLESIPGHQAIDKCEEKIQEFLEILKYQQEQGFGRNQQELQRLHQTLIEQAEERSKQLANPEATTLAPTSFWRRVQKKIKTTYDSAKDKAKEVIG
ncbi:uncharacterized protein LOC117652692 [Thrips palmi]|uniref:Uncharacterized protein LOC117652692 n=1 Tax=Thrips palmi TaxID=161013 RepID=A0A6P9A7Z8_THRPL|nr:uncharacterized protein LOC117652692 [Thrips palmi]